jgi:hypothetical protein
MAEWTSRCDKSDAGEADMDHRKLARHVAKCYVIIMNSETMILPPPPSSRSTLPTVDRLRAVSPIDSSVSTTARWIFVSTTLPTVRPARAS